MNRGNSVLVSLEYKQINGEATAGLAFVLDESGDEKPDSRYFTDLYTCDQDRMGDHIFPDPDDGRACSL
jgi:hypothetical protein